MKRPSFLAVSDESGGQDRPPLVLACLSGPLTSLLALERELGGLLEKHDLTQLKWSRLRTRAASLNCARAWLDLMAQAAARGELLADLVVDRRPGQAKLPRWLQLYHRVLRAAVGRWPSGHWGYWPDQRTGLDWNEFRRETNRRLKKTFTARKIAVRQIKPQRAQARPLLQAADLLAGLMHLKHEPRRRPGDDGPGAKAERNRRALLAPVFFTRAKGPFRILRLERR